MRVFFKNLQYIWYILRHKYFVLYSGITQVGGIPLTSLLLHDLSKFSPTEFFTYRKKFYRAEEEDPPAQEDWDLALLHHYHHNAHHSEFWTLNKALPMPEVYVREMLADWMAVTLDKHDNLQEWIDQTVRTKPFHDQTQLIIKRVLREIGIPNDFLDRP